MVGTAKEIVYYFYGGGEMTMSKSYLTKYSAEIIKRVKSNLSKEVQDFQIETLSKIEIMDNYLASYSVNVSSKEIFQVVKEVFGIDLDIVPIYKRALPQPSSTEIINTSSPRLLLDTYLEKNRREITEKKIRELIEFIFGINLFGISSLKNAKLSLFSKGHWLVQNNKDIFSIHTGPLDVYLEISITNYFTEQTGLKKLPIDLKLSLCSLGFSYDNETGRCYLTNTTGESVSDDFKNKMMKVITDIIKKNYSHL